MTITVQYINRKKDELVRHVKALEAIHQSLLSVQKLTQLDEDQNDTIKSALFTAVIIQYGRAFKGNKKNGSSEIYPTRQLKKLTGFSVSLHNEILDIRDKFIAHQDWDVEGRAFGMSTAEVHLENKPSYKFIAQHVLTITSLMGANKEILIIWEKHIKNIRSGLHILADKVLEELTFLGLTHAKLFKTDQTKVKQQTIETRQLTKKMSTKLPAVNSEFLSRIALDKSEKSLGTGYHYNYLSVSKQAPTKFTVNRGTPEEITVEISPHLSKNTEE